MDLRSTSKRTLSLKAIWPFSGLSICLIFLVFLIQTNPKLSFGTLLGDFYSSNFTRYTRSEAGTIDFVEKHVNRTKRGCNIFEGKWVYKPDEGPRYNATWCYFLKKKFNCKKNGRPDTDYEKWRWEARDCDIPLFNGRDMLQRLRDKRLIIVGDSTSNNMWDSLACLLYSSIPSATIDVRTIAPGFKAFKVKDYNFSLEFYASPFLVELNRTNTSNRRVLVIDEISSLAERWRGAHYMVFNTDHWWIASSKIKRWDVIQYKGQLIEEMPIELAFEQGFTTWANWVENNVDPSKTTVVYRSMSPNHWACVGANVPMGEVHDPSSDLEKTLTNTIERVIKGMKKSQVKYLDVTNLSMYRKDAHPSIYYDLSWKNETSPNVGDCSHWCLPGLPDTWNRLLYTFLFF